MMNKNCVGSKSTAAKKNEASAEELNKTPAEELSDGKIIANAKKGKGGKEFELLWEGKWEELDDIGSLGDACRSLNIALRSYAGDGRADELFWKSGLASQVIENPKRRRRLPQWSRATHD
jgi:hypothetical protein